MIPQNQDLTKKRIDRNVFLFIPIVAVLFA